MRARVFPPARRQARHVLGSPEFVSIKDGDPTLVAHRARAAAGRFRLNHDDGIVARLGGFAGRPAAETLLLYGRALDEASRATVDRLRATARIDCIDGLTPSGPLLLRSTPELLIRARVHRPSAAGPERLTACPCARADAVLR